MSDHEYDSQLFIEMVADLARSLDEYAGDDRAGGPTERRLGRATGYEEAAKWIRDLFRHCRIEMPGE